MRRLVMVSAVLSAVICLIHIIGGGSAIYHLIQASSLSIELKAVSAVIWHFVSVLLVFCAIGLFWSAKHVNIQLEILVVAIFGAFSVLFVYYGIATFNSVLVMPQWLLFLVPTLLLVVDWKRRRHA
ncbi:hypothetical protein [Thalassotalea ganghwensis]